MEKTIVFLPLIIFFGIFGFLIVAFIGFVLKLLKKSKDSYWIGKVIDKKSFDTEDTDDRPVTIYHLVVLMDDGKEKKVGLSKQMYDGFEIGDRIEKPKGTLYPRKL